jgi:predicted NAD-dependent protein-ADP-ribosyltransferase YbiA (DUF1768 family)
MTTNDIINFFSGKKEYRSLSNFWENDVIVNGRTYESGEHCFQGEKYIRICELSSEKRKKVLLEYGITFLKPSPYKTATIAKKMGGKKGMLLNPMELKLWEEIGIDTQYDICEMKIEYYEEVKNDLIKSGDKILIHPALRCSIEQLERTRVWEGKGIIKDGKVVVFGKNKLGNIWMEIRKNLKSNFIKK